MYVFCRASALVRRIGGQEGILRLASEYMSERRAPARGERSGEKGGEEHEHSGLT
jgi:hypothetical protein